MPKSKSSEKTQQFIAVQRTLYWILLSSEKQIVVRSLQYPSFSQSNICWVEVTEHPFSTDPNYIPIMELPGYLVDPEAEAQYGQSSHSRKRKALRNIHGHAKKRDRQDTRQPRKRNAATSNEEVMQSEKRTRFSELY